MKKASINVLLPKVRKAVLKLRAEYPDESWGKHTGRFAFSLTQLTYAVTEPSQWRSRRNWRLVNRSQYTAGIHKEIRGHVNTCCAILAREGLLFGRNRPETVVERYNRPVDKYFEHRLTREEAAKRLAAMN